MKINEFPEISEITDNDFILCWDAETGTTRKIKAFDLKAYFGGAVELTNLALFATATASSQYSSSYTPQLAVDGSTSTDWASLGQQTPWIRLTFQTPKTVSKARIADRTNPFDAANAGNLVFSDGSSVSVTGIPDNGSFKAVEFTPRTVDWVEFQVTAGTGGNVGLSEIEIWGY